MQKWSKAEQTPHATSIENKTKNQMRRRTVKGSARRSALCGQGHGHRRLRLHNAHHPFSHRDCFVTCVYIQGKQNSCRHRCVVQQSADHSDILFCELPNR